MPTSKWTHALCEVCWVFLHPGRMPVLIRDPETEICCRCFCETRSGIYVRGAPADMPCGGLGHA